jgi:hypothetical protein
MIPEEQMPHSPQLDYNNGGSRYRSIAVIIIMIYLSFLVYVAALNVSFIPQMEEAGEETAELLNTGEAGGGGSVQVIHNDMVDEVRTAFIITLISFGILDGIFALMLWLKRVKNSHRTALIALLAIQILNRILCAYIIVIFSIWVLVATNPRTIMNTVYLVLTISVAVSVVLALIIYFYLMGSKTQKMAFKIRQKTTV